MHFEILAEDASGKKALDILIPKIIGDQHTFRVIGYKGIGRIPKNLTSGTDASTRLLLDQLPRLLRGYGKTYTGYPENYPAAVILVCDLDDRCLKTFRQELFTVLNACNPKPETRFCLAIEESEAWLLGDVPALKVAYPKLKNDVLNGYKNDSICRNLGASGRRRIHRWLECAQEPGLAGSRQGKNSMVRENRSSDGCGEKRVAQFPLLSKEAS